MINVDILKNIIDEKLWQMEEIIKALDSIDYCRDDFLSYSGPANDVFKEAESKLRNILYGKAFRELDENYIILALFLRETSHWFIDELIGMAEGIDCPLNILNGYTMYRDFCFYKTEGQEIRRYETIEDLKEKLFERYKYNRNVEDDNKNNIRILRLLTLVDEYKQAISEEIVDEKYFTGKFN